MRPPLHLLSSRVTHPTFPLLTHITASVRNARASPSLCFQRHSGAQRPAQNPSGLRPLSASFGGCDNPRLPAGREVTVPHGAGTASRPDAALRAAVADRSGPSRPRSGKRYHPAGHDGQPPPPPPQTPRRAPGPEALTPRKTQPSAGLRPPLRPGSAARCAWPRAEAALTV